MGASFAESEVSCDSVSKTAHNQRLSALLAVSNKRDNGIEVYKTRLRAWCVYNRGIRNRVTILNFVLNLNFPFSFSIFWMRKTENKWEPMRSSEKDWEKVRKANPVWERKFLYVNLLLVLTYSTQSRLRNRKWEREKIENKWDWMRIGEPKWEWVRMENWECDTISDAPAACVALFNCKATSARGGYMHSFPNCHGKFIKTNTAIVGTTLKLFKTEIPKRSSLITFRQAVGHYASMENGKYASR